MSFNLLTNSCNRILESFHSYIRVKHAVGVSYIPGYSGVLAILVLVISEHFNITDPIEMAGAQQIVWLSRGLVISEVGISGTNCITDRITFNMIESFQYSAIRCQYSLKLCQSCFIHN